jgi:predicted HAD superfamily Cof-like phosphohydrolase
MSYENVEEFLRKMKIPQAASPRLLADDVMKKRYNHLIEEANEFAHSNAMSDLDGVVDSLIDVVYVALGTASMLGLTQDQWEDCFERVHIANMQKRAVKDEGGHKLGVEKPEGWEAPNFKGILEQEEEYPVNGEL